MKSDEILARELETLGRCCVDQHGEDYDNGTCPEYAHIVDYEFSCTLCWLGWARKEAQDSESHTDEQEEIVSIGIKYINPEDE